MFDKEIIHCHTKEEYIKVLKKLNDGSLGNPSRDIWEHNEENTCIYIKDNKFNTWGDKDGMKKHYLNIPMITAKEFSRTLKE